MERIGGEEVHPPTSIRKVALASFIGSTVEWYDFFIYGTATALVFNQLFFPTENPLVGTLAAFATFGVGFLFRPLGGAFFGHFGDKIGRKAMLIITLLVMGAATVLIGCLPTYNSVGILAPILLVLLRCVQGFSVGGEWAGGALRGDAALGGCVRHLLEPTGGAVSGLGLAHAVPAERGRCAGRALYQAQDRRVAGVRRGQGDPHRGPSADPGCLPCERQEHPSHRGHASGDKHHLLRIDRLRPLLCHRELGYLQFGDANQYPHHRSLRFRGQAALWPALGQDRPAADLCCGLNHWSLGGLSLLLGPGNPVGYSDLPSLLPHHQYLPRP